VHLRLKPRAHGRDAHATNGQFLTEPYPYRERYDCCQLSDVFGAWVRVHTSRGDLPLP
jgi:hypothetical protein